MVTMTVGGEKLLARVTNDDNDGSDEKLTARLAVVAMTVSAEKLSVARSFGPRRLGDDDGRWRGAGGLSYKCLTVTVGGEKLLAQVTHLAA